MKLDFNILKLDIILGINQIFYIEFHLTPKLIFYDFEIFREEVN